MTKPAAKTIALPKPVGGSVTSLLQHDVALNTVLSQYYADVARRANASLGTDGSDPMTGDLNLGGHNINNIANVNLTGVVSQNGGAGYRLTRYSGLPISGLVPGSTFGSLLEGEQNAHIVLGIRDNDAQDSLSVVSYDGTGNYSKMVLNARASGIINIFGQIGFPAVPNLSTGATVLDDYREGSFTPTFTAETTPPTSVTYDPNFNYGRYGKVGRNVFVYGRMRTTAVTIGAMAGNLAIGGLPFAASTTGAVGGVALNVGFRAGFVTNLPDSLAIFPTIGAGLTMRMYYNPAGASTLALLPANVSPTINDVMFSGWYITDN